MTTPIERLAIQSHLKELGVDDFGIIVDFGDSLRRRVCSFTCSENKYIYATLWRSEQWNEDSGDCSADGVYLVNYYLAGRAKNSKSFQEIRPALEYVVAVLWESVGSVVI